MDIVPAVASITENLLPLLGTLLLDVVLAGVGGLSLALGAAMVQAIPRVATDFEPEDRALILLVAPLFLMLALISFLAGLAMIGSLVLQVARWVGASTFVDATESWLGSPSANVVEGRAFILLFGLLMVAFAFGVAVVCLAAVPRIGRHIEGFNDVVRMVFSGLCGLVFLLITVVFMRELLNAVF